MVWDKTVKACEAYPTSILFVEQSLARAAKWLNGSGLDVKAQVATVGSSWKGRKLVALVVESVRTKDRGGDVVIIGGMHAREWISIAAPLCMVHTHRNRLATMVQQGHRVLILPLLNPDGFAYSLTKRRHWRKTRSDLGDGNFGVDLNRNFGIKNLTWGFGDPFKTKSEIYQGSQPFSEPESRAVQLLVDEWLREGSVVLDVHCCANVVLPPMDADSQLLHFAKRLANATKRLGYRDRSKEYGPNNSGVAVDWVQSRPNVFAALMVELAGSANASSFKELFKTPPDMILPAAGDILATLEATFHSFSCNQTSHLHDSAFATPDLTKLLHHRKHDNLVQPQDKVQSVDEEVYNKAQEDKSNGETLLMVPKYGVLPIGSQYMPRQVSARGTLSNGESFGSVREEWVTFVWCSVFVLCLVLYRLLRSHYNKKSISL